MQYLAEVQPVFYLPASHIFGWKNQSCPNFIGPNHTNSCTLQWVVPKLFHSLAMTLRSKFVVLRNDYVHNADKKTQLCWHIALSVSRFQGSLQKRSGFLCPLANGETDINRWSVFTEVLFLYKTYILKKIEKNSTQFPRLHLCKQANQIHGTDLSWVPQSSHHFLADSSTQLCLDVTYNAMSL